MNNLTTMIEQLVDERVRALLAEHRCDPTAGRQRAGAPPRTAYSVPEVARSIGMSTRHVYTLVESGALPSIRIGRRVLIPVGELDRFIGRAPSGAA